MGVRCRVSLSTAEPPADGLTGRDVFYLERERPRLLHFSSTKSQIGAADGLATDLGSGLKVGAADR